MSRIRILSLVATSVALLALSACDDSSSSSDSTGGGNPVGKWGDVSLEEDGGYTSYDSTVSEFLSNNTATTYGLSWEKGPSGIAYRNESLNAFNWSVAGDQLRIVATSCKEKEVGGEWVDDTDCSPGEEERMTFKVDGDYFIIYSPGGGGSVDADTLRRIR